MNSLRFSNRGHFRVGPNVKFSSNSAIQIKLAAWIEDVGIVGLREVRKIAGYHDEPLKGKRQGQRSIRLSKHYRAIYVIQEATKTVFVEVREISKHEY